MIWKKLSVLLTLCLFGSLLSGTANAQMDDSKALINTKKGGFLVEYGLPFWKLPEDVYYHPIMFKASVEYPLWQAHRYFNMSFEFTPTFGFSATKGDHVMEFGLGIRLKANFLVSERDLLSILASFGPHWTSVQTVRVADGFLFAGNWMGVYERMVDLPRKWMTVVVGAGFRHISNAGLKKPNIGIDNILFSAGIRFPFEIIIE